MIRTVTGDMERTRFGKALVHEHIQCLSNDMYTAFGKKWADTDRIADHAVKILGRLKQDFGVGLMVDGTPIDLGRNVRLIKQVSERTGVPIVASTGLYYFPAMISVNRSAKELAGWFLEECERGMEGTGIRPGILKCAADRFGMIPDTKKRLEALGMVQRETGLPLYAHCSHNDNLAAEMIKVFEDTGVDREKTIIGHASIRPDAEYLERILERGYYISIDQCRRGQEEKMAQAVQELCEKGYAKKLLFSYDGTWYSDFGAKGTEGLDYPVEVHLEQYVFLFRELVSALRTHGCGEEMCRMFFEENVLDVLDIS